MSEADDYTTDEGEFDLDQWQAEAQRKPYPFVWGGATRHLPHVMDLPTGILDLIGSDDAQDVGQILEMAFGAEQWAEINAVKPVPIGATAELFNRWMAHSGVNRGEAQNSAASSNGTAEPLRRTSRSGASTSARRSSAGRKSGTRRASSST